MTNSNTDRTSVDWANMLTEKFNPVAGVQNTVQSWGRIGDQVNGIVGWLPEEYRPKNDPGAAINKMFEPLIEAFNKFLQQIFGNFQKTVDKRSYAASTALTNTLTEANFQPLATLLPVAELQGPLAECAKKYSQAMFLGGVKMSTDPKVALVNGKRFYNDVYTTIVDDCTNADSDMTVAQIRAYAAQVASTASGLPINADINTLNPAQITNGFTGALLAAQNQAKTDDTVAIGLKFDLAALQPRTPAPIPPQAAAAAAVAAKGNTAKPATGPAPVVPSKPATTPAKS